LKKVVLHSEATALASMVLPVPGGPTIKMPFQGRRMPRKNSGMISGNTTASCSNDLASPKPAMSFQPTPGLRLTTSASKSSAKPRSSLCLRANSARSLPDRDFLDPAPLERRLRSPWPRLLPSLAPPTRPRLNGRCSSSEGSSEAGLSSSDSSLSSPPPRRPLPSLPPARSRRCECDALSADRARLRLRLASGLGMAGNSFSGG